MKEKEEVRIAIKKYTYKKKDGWLLTGFDKKGKAIKNFVSGSKEDAEAVRDYIKNGYYSTKKVPGSTPIKEDYKNIFEIKEEVKIGDHILEVGDKIEVLKESMQMYSVYIRFEDWDDKNTFSETYKRSVVSETEFEVNLEGPWTMIMEIIEDVNSVYGSDNIRLRIK